MLGITGRRGGGPQGPGGVVDLGVGGRGVGVVAHHGVDEGPGPPPAEGPGHRRRGERRIGHARLWPAAGPRSRDSARTRCRPGRGWRRGPSGRETSPGPPTPPAAISGTRVRPHTDASNEWIGRSASGRKSLARLPRCAPASEPWRQSASGPRRSAAVASSGVVTVSTTSDARGLQRPHRVERRQAEGEADHRGRFPEHEVELARVVVVVPPRRRRVWPRARRPRDRARAGRRPGRRGSAVGPPGQEEVHPERPHTGGPHTGHLLGQRLGRLVAAGQKAEGAGGGHRHHQVDRRRAAGHGRATPAESGSVPAGARRQGWRRRPSARPRRTSARYGGQLHGVARPGHHAALHGSGPRVPPRPRARRGARTPARHRPFRSVGRQPAGLAGDRGQGSRQSGRPCATSISPAGTSTWPWARPGWSR